MMKQILSTLALITGFKGICLMFKKETWTNIKNVVVWESILEHLEWTFKFYSFTLIIPIFYSVAYVIFTILGINESVEFFEIWFDYFATGDFLDIAAWRWQLLLFLIANVIVLLSKLDEEL